MKKLFVVLTLCFGLLFAASGNDSATSAFVEGCRAYSQGDWASAKFMLT